MVMLGQFLRIPWNIEISHKRLGPGRWNWGNHIMAWNLVAWCILPWSGSWNGHTQLKLAFSDLGRPRVLSFTERLVFITLQYLYASRRKAFLRVLCDRWLVCSIKFQCQFKTILCGFKMWCKFLYVLILNDNMSNDIMILLGKCYIKKVISLHSLLTKILHQLGQCHAWWCPDNSRGPLY